MEENNGELAIASPTYGNTHRAFLQALLSRQALTYEAAKPLIAHIETAQNPDRPTLAEDVSLQDFEEYVQRTNEALSPFEFEIRSALHQTTRERVWALINTTSDALTQMSTMHSPDELAFLKRVLDAMFDTYNTSRAEIVAVTSMQAIKLAKPVGEASRRESSNNTQSSAGLTMSQAEKVLSRLVAEGWFELSPKGFYSLSPRALMELRSWLIDTYNETDSEEDDDERDETEAPVKIRLCAACRDIVTVGQRCPNLPCNARLHNHCVSKMFRAQSGSETCPTCKTEWKDAPLVGERAARAGANNSRTSNSVSVQRDNRNAGRDNESDSTDAAT